MNFTLLRILAVFILGATGAFPATVTFASFYEQLNYASPWDVSKPIIPPSTIGRGEYATAGVTLGLALVMLTGKDSKLRLALPA